MVMRDRPLYAFGAIKGHDGGIPVMYTKLNIISHQGFKDSGMTYHGKGIAIHLPIDVPYTLAHELGHWAGWTGGDRANGEHTSNENNVMFSADEPGEVYDYAVNADKQYLQKVLSLAH